MIIYDGTEPINISINIDCSRNLFSQTSILIGVFYKHCVFLSILLTLNVSKRIRTNDEIKKRSQKPKTEYKFPGPLHNLCGSIIIHDVSLQSWPSQAWLLVCRLAKKSYFFSKYLAL